MPKSNSKKKDTEASPKKKLKVDGVEKSSSSSSMVEDIEQGRLEAGKSVESFPFIKKRVRILSGATEVKENSSGIVYWMSRDQRIQDNWACLFAQRLALKNKLPLHVCFCLVPKFLDATIRQFGFMLKGLEEVSSECSTLGMNFHLLRGEAKSSLVKFVKDYDIGAVVTDFAPLRVPLGWVEDVKKNLPNDVSLCQVDAHNIVPCWVASEKLEYGARTIRPKIHNKLSEFLTEFPPVINHPYPPKIKAEAIDWDEVQKFLEVDRSVEEVQWATPGTRAGMQMLHEFIQKRLKLFGEKRNDPTVDALSNLSPWFHFGQVSVQRCILEVKKQGKSNSKSVEAFVEEAVVRRELADNFCFNNPNYDSIKGAYDWARKTLNDHKDDKRSYLYTRKELEEAKTHDDLWNAAQIQMVSEGKMHGFLRMYWAKKILEWTASPEEALTIAIYLNDKYELDGRDPNGYVGCMWSICGIHDQGWAERPVFGKIRFMNYQGCKRKFDVDSFVRKYKARAFSKK